jgi:hypothetical protein
MRILAARIIFLYCFVGLTPRLVFQIDTSLASVDPLDPSNVRGLLSEVFETGEAVLALNPKSAVGFTSAANPELLPKPKPRTTGLLLIMPSIRSREVVRAQGSGVR